jgi:hypothetical protein
VVLVIQGVINNQTGAQTLEFRNLNIDIGGLLIHVDYIGSLDSNGNFVNGDFGEGFIAPTIVGEPQYNEQTTFNSIS